MMIRSSSRISGDFRTSARFAGGAQNTRNPKSEIRNPLQTGSALLAVLWLSLALSAIAFSLASTVQGETERTATAVDGLRSYYLATGAIERAILYIKWGKSFPPSLENPTPFYSPQTPLL